MKTRKKRRIWVGVLVVILILAAFFVIRALTGSRLTPLDTDGALVSLTQHGDTIVFFPMAPMRSREMWKLGDLFFLMKQAAHIP